MNIFILLFLTVSSLFASPVQEEKKEVKSIQQEEKLAISCTEELQDILDLVYQIPSAKPLLSQALELGAVRIKLNRNSSFPFDAYWDSTSRTIFVNRSFRAPQGQVLWPLLFELHNAARQRDFNHIDALAKMRAISREDYIKEAEYIEYQNALATSSLFEEAIKHKLVSREEDRRLRAGLRLPSLVHQDRSFGVLPGRR